MIAGKRQGRDDASIVQSLLDQHEQSWAANRALAKELCNALGAQRTTLNEAPDGYGYFYGTLQRGEEIERLNIMPPLPYWSGDDKQGKYAPHATQWVVYLNGEEVARATSINQLKV